MAAPFSPADFDAGDPAAFYLLGPGRADMQALADATLVVEGRRLPAHSSVLGLQAGVLRGLFADFLGGGGGVGCKRKADSEEGPVIEAPFQDCSLFEACLFLRFCYRPEERTPVNLTAVQHSLPGLLRLAHKLDAPQIQQAVCECLADKARSATMPQLLEWMAAAERCQLPELRLGCLREVAGRLASGSGGLPCAFADAALLAEHCDKSALVQLVGLLADAASADNLAVASAAVTALHQAANPGSFEWALERYSQQPSAVGQVVESPWFSAAGKEWRFKVYPGGYKAGDAGHVSVFLFCNQPGTRAEYIIAVVDQAAEAPQHVGGRSSEPFTFGSSARGWTKFLAHDELRARPGYLAGDRLVLRARVELLL